MAAEHDNNERTVIVRRDPLLGATFDRRFRIDAKIAAGGFGAIYRATHLDSGHEFALKMLHSNLTHDPHVVARFRREGAALTRLRDPHTITAYQLGEAPDGTLYIVMELLHGESLYDRYRVHGPMPWRRVMTMARAVCSSLAEAHAHGIIHRDLKPTNIHLEPRGPERDFVKVLDFGIAKILHDSDLDSSDLTQVGQMIGTLDYMSPEQMVGGQCTATSDIYTLGVVMYELIAGRKPFDDAGSAASALAAVLTTVPQRLCEQAKVTAAADEVVMRCLERAQSDRFQTALELATALDDILSGRDYIAASVAARSSEVTQTQTAPLLSLRALPEALLPHGGGQPAGPAAGAQLRIAPLVAHAPAERSSSPQIAAPAAQRSPGSHAIPGPLLRGSASLIASPHIEPSAPQPAGVQWPPAPQPGSAAPQRGSMSAQNATPRSSATPHGSQAVPQRGSSPQILTAPAAAPQRRSSSDLDSLPQIAEAAPQRPSSPQIPVPTAPGAAAVPPLAATTPTSASAAPAGAGRSSSPQLAPSVPRPPPLDDDIQPMFDPSKPGLVAPPPRSLGSPVNGSAKNLREAYPTIHLPPPSPMRPPWSAFDDRPTTAIVPLEPEEMVTVVRRGTTGRRLALAVSFAAAIVAAFLVARWLDIARWF